MKNRFSLNVIFVLVASLAHGSEFKSPLALHKVKIPNSPRYWKENGFVNLEAPLRLPSDKLFTDIIKVWIKIPNDGKIGVSWIKSQSRYSLIYPKGTVADRVEMTKDYSKIPETEEIDDVRGARISVNGETLFHVYEEAPGKSDHWLYGYEWKREGDIEDHEAGEALVKLYFPPTQNWNQQVIKTFLKRNYCANCHQPNTPAPATVPFMRYETDTRGFFQPLSVLERTMTVRDHRDWDLNADDPFVSVFCGAELTQAQSSNSTRGYSCPGNVAPVGATELKSALKLDDSHGKVVCETRRYLFNHMTRKARLAFKEAFADCAIN